MRKRRKLIAVSDLYRRIPKVLSAAAPAPSISISAAPAGTGTEVATREQLSSVVQDKFCPTLFPQADLTVPPVFEMEEECSLLVNYLNNSLKGHPPPAIGQIDCLQHK